VGISFTELLVVFLVALVLFGPDKLPELARHLGHLTGQLKKTTDGIRRELYNSVYPPGFDPRKGLAGELKELRSLKAQIMAPPVGSVSANTSPKAPSVDPEPPADTAKDEPKGAP
jgi:sec-independent protein translocase protein TatA